MRFYIQFLNWKITVRRDRIIEIDICSVLLSENILYQWISGKECFDVFEAGDFGSQSAHWMETTNEAPPGARVSPAGLHAGNVRGVERCASPAVVRVAFCAGSRRVVSAGRSICRSMTSSNPESQSCEPVLQRVVGFLISSSEWSTRVVSPSCDHPGSGRRGD